MIPLGDPVFNVDLRSASADHPDMKRATTPIALVLIFGLAACTTTPDATELPPEEGGARIQVIEAPPAVEGAEPPTPPAGEPEVHYEALALKGVRGGLIRCEIDGRPEDIKAMLLDFAHAAGRRAWARSYEFLREADGSVFARWDFEGKAGINPSVVLEFRERSRDGTMVIRYRLAETAFGLGAFFGDYQATALPETTPPRSQFTQRVFIDSGTWLANASQEEIEAGLREDTRLIRAWMRERLADPAD
ncbi:MAG: hypothetical protein KDB53_21810 [Planctomycetes bacterium]|nr:hypothetical protein [Planctomycetota bacterium]